MTKVEALREFKETVLPKVIQQYGPKDVPARCEAWNDFVDALQKDGLVTAKQAHIWTNPF